MILAHRSQAPCEYYFVDPPVGFSLLPASVTRPVTVTGLYPSARVVFRRLESRPLPPCLPPLPRVVKANKFIGDSTGSRFPGSFRSVTLIAHNDDNARAPGVPVQMAGWLTVNEPRDRYSAADRNHTGHVFIVHPAGDRCGDPS